MWSLSPPKRDSFRNILPLFSRIDTICEIYYPFSNRIDTICNIYYPFSNAKRVIYFGKKVFSASYYPICGEKKGCSFVKRLLFYRQKQLLIVLNSEFGDGKGSKQYFGCSNHQPNILKFVLHPIINL